MRTQQFCGEKVVSNAVSGVLLSGPIAHSVGVTQSCLPLGRPHRITAAEGNAIRSLDGRPAVRSLIESLAGPCGDLTDDLHRLASHVFVGLPTAESSSWKHGDYIVRSILGVDPDDGAVYVGCEVREGDTIGFMLRDPAGAREDLKAMLECSAPSGRHPALGFYFNCCARGAGLYGMPEIDTAYIRNALPALPVVGFFGFSEIAPGGAGTRCHNYSGVMALVSEAATA
jgi:small ligand-binding sensory domain FIST